MGYPLHLQSGKTVELTDIRPDASNFVTTWGVGVTTVEGQQFAVAYVMYFRDMQPHFYAVPIVRIRGVEGGHFALTVLTYPWLPTSEPHVYTTTHPDPHHLIDLVNAGYVLAQVTDMAREARLTVQKVQDRQTRQRTYGFLKGIMEILDLLAHRDSEFAHLYHVGEPELVEVAKLVVQMTRDLPGEYYEGQRDGSWALLDYFSDFAKSRPDGTLVIEPELLVNAVLAMIPQIRMLYAGVQPEGGSIHES